MAQHALEQHVPSAAMLRSQTSALWGAGKSSDKHEHNEAHLRAFRHRLVALLALAALLELRAFVLWQPALRVGQRAWVLRVKVLGIARLALAVLALPLPPVSGLLLRVPCCVCSALWPACAHTFLSAKGGG